MLGTTVSCNNSNSHFYMPLLRRVPEVTLTKCFQSLPGLWLQSPLHKYRKNVTPPVWTVSSKSWMVIKLINEVKNRQLWCRSMQWISCLWSAFKQFYKLLITSMCDTALAGEGVATTPLIGISPQELLKRDLTLDTKWGGCRWSGRAVSPAIRWLVVPFS